MNTEPLPPGIRQNADGSVSISSRDGIEAVCTCLVQAGSPPVLTLLRAAADGRINLLAFTDPDGAWPTQALDRSTRPTIILISDDPHPIGIGVALGPDRWRCAKRLKYWCSAAIVHESGGESSHYAGVIATAGLFGRLAFYRNRLGSRKALGDVPSLPEHIAIPAAPGWAASGRGRERTVGAMSGETVPLDRLRMPKSAGPSGTLIGLAPQMPEPAERRPRWQGCAPRFSRSATPATPEVFRRLMRNAISADIDADELEVIEAAEASQRAVLSSFAAEQRVQL